ncbi:MAG: hypothetical protein Q4D80_06150, partial [Pseudomonadota bacterium]|nr:hypothetical protein [Pseudomonadota bacterium]
MADGYLIDETEYSNGKEEEEDPILVAQRYLNIFHQIHIFNAAKKAEFDQSLLSMPEKIKELMATIPGGRVLLEHVQEIEEKKGLSSGETSELISQNLKEEKKALTQQKPSSGGELTLGADFAESLASSLATALQNNNVAANGNITDLAIILNKSFNAYATSMQNLTASLMRRGGDISAGNIPPVSPAPDAPVAAQQNMQNNNSTTVNNINFDSSYFNSITQALMQNDARRHEDMMQIVSALNKSLVPAGTFSAATPVVTNNATSDVPTLAIANSVTEALRQNNSQQMELIKAFGEMLVQAITQSQQELAQTIAQSAPRHVVKVVVSQDVDVENQTAENIVSKPIENKNNTPKNPPKKDEDTKEKTNFVKNFSDKINETTSKLSKNLNASNKPSGGNNNASSDSLLNRINKSLNKINELRKQTDKNAQEQEKQPQPKPEPKPEQKPQPQPQPRPEPKPEQKTQPQP